MDFSLCSDRQLIDHFLGKHMDCKFYTSDYKHIEDELKSRGIPIDELKQDIQVFCEEMKIKYAR